MLSRKKIISVVMFPFCLISSPSMAKGPEVSGPVFCAELSTGLANDPSVKTMTSQIIKARGPNPAYCQVDILYGTNPDQNINIRVGLPINSLDGGSGGVEGAWNGRTQGIGGSRCAGRLNVVVPVREGYVGSGNDTGHSGDDCTPGVNEDGTYNYQFNNDFIRNGIKAQVLFMKSVTQSYYGMKSAYNYWNGCSTGGRQGYLLAQELGTELDGILANAPAIYLTRFQTAQMWGQIVMKDLSGGPIDHDKLVQTTTSAVDACDTNDGVTDGVIDDPRTCMFSATENICGEDNAPASNCLTPAEAEAIDMIWDGPRNTYGDKVWYGLERGTDLTALNDTDPFPLGITQLQWDEHDRNFDWLTVTVDDYAQVAQDGSRNIADLTDTFGDLDRFRRHGGKMITMVGANDQLIMPSGVMNYYRQMASRYDYRQDLHSGQAHVIGHGNDVDFTGVQGFYRLFRAPGVGHCTGGVGPQPEGLFEALVDWVENGNAPEQIPATSDSSSRPLCPYPQMAVFDENCGDPDEPNCFACGGNLETAPVVCNDVLVKYKHEVKGPLDFTGTGFNRHECYKR